MNAGDGRAAVSLRRAGAFHGPAGRRNLEVSKTYTLDGKGILSVEYRIANPGSDRLDLWMGIEFNLTLLSGKSQDRFISYAAPKPVSVKAGSRGEAEGVSYFELVNRAEGFTVRVAWNEKAGLWHFPVETVSQSEKGFDLNYQGSSLMPHFRFALPPGAAKDLSFTVSISPS